MEERLEDREKRMQKKKKDKAEIYKEQSVDVENERKRRRHLKSQESNDFV